ncbi:hypothetical protein DXG01_013654 [Tephrocybe rancida]|nr:hypothetical protein DXG01_013654 [Tephrocybe rancida]
MPRFPSLHIPLLVILLISSYSSKPSYLLSKRPDYARTVAKNRVADFLADLQHGYLKRFGVHLDLEPTQEELECVDDSAADTEPAVLDPEVMSDGEYEEAIRVFNECRHLVTYCRAQIRCWMAYQYYKDREHAAKDTGVQEAFLALLQQLSDKGFPKPRCITASNHWQSIPENCALVEKEVSVRMDILTSRKNRAGICTKVVSELFNGLSPKVQEEWKAVSREQHGLAIADCIEATIPFMQQILDLVLKLTSMKTTFMFGSPEPVDGGRLNVISIHSGHMPGDIKMNFRASKQEYHQKVIVPVFSRFLKKCYTIEDCRARALPQATPSLSSLMDEHAYYASLVSLGDLSQLFSQRSPAPAMPSEAPAPPRHSAPPELNPRPAFPPLNPGPRPASPVPDAPKTTIPETLKPPAPISPSLKRVSDSAKPPLSKRLKSLPPANPSSQPPAPPHNCPPRLTKATAPSTSAQCQPTAPPPHPQPHPLT